MLPHAKWGTAACMDMVVIMLLSATARESKLLPNKGFWH
jgi:hypothetical protein